MNPLVSIIIPAYNEEKYIGKCISSLLSQTFKNFEILVVDDGSTDGTQKIVSSFPNVKLLTGQHKGPGASRNLGARDAKGKILVFVDSDMTFDEDYLKNLVSPIVSQKEVVGTTHELEIVKNLDNIWSRCWGRIRVSKEQAKNVKIFRAIKKSVFIKLGGFDSKYGYADDQTLWFKYKVGPIVAENTKCYHRNPQSLKEVYAQSRWIGSSIDSIFLRSQFSSYLFPFMLIAISPLAIPFLALKKSASNKDFSILFPWMISFMFFRYFGTISGLLRKVYLDKNVR